MYMIRTFDNKCLVDGTTNQALIFSDFKSAALAMKGYKSAKDVIKVNLSPAVWEY